MKVAELPFFRHINWRPDSKELRKFAVSMLIGFTVLGVLAAWRAGEIRRPSAFLWIAGVTLAVAAVVPGLGRTAYLMVYLPTSIIGYFVSHLVLALAFFIVFTPLGIFLRLTGKDPLQLRPQRESKWRPIKVTKDADSYYHQF